jgi:hypothetical protein
MNRKTRSKLDMGDRALNFSLARPDASPGYAAALAGLQERLAKAQQLARTQEEGINHRKAANARKNHLRRQMRETQLRHLARVAKVAIRETPELAGKFMLKSQPRPYRSFRAQAGSMVAEAQTQKDVLVKHGLADTVLESLVQSLDQFDRAVMDGTDAFRSHVGASAELDVLANEVVDIVEVMDGLNRFRFADDAAVLAEWEAVSNVIGPPHPAEVKPKAPGQSSVGDVRPAA